MKTIILLGLAMAAGYTLSSPALASEKYPAANFQPTVIYIDKSAVAATEPEEAIDPKYPAANFQPKVIYSDANLTASSNQTAENHNEADPKYPAAYFQPKVIYP